MSWSAYHDSIAQEIALLYSDPNWSTDPVILRRLYGNNQNPTDPDQGSLVYILQQAGAETGQIPKFEIDPQTGKPTGKIERDAQGNVVFQSQAEGMANLLEQFETSRLEAEAANEQRYQDIIGGYQDRISGVMTGKNADGSFNAALHPTAWSTLRNRYEFGDAAEAITELENRRTGVLSDYDQYGQQARRDIQNTYQQRIAETEQDLINRGLGNTTVRSSNLAGLTSKEAQDVARFDQERARERATLNASLWGDVASAKQHKADTLLGFGTQGMNMAANLTAQPLEAMERRTDVGPGLGDVAQLATGFGRSQASSGFQLGAFNPATYYQQRVA